MRVSPERERCQLLRLFIYEYHLATITLVCKPDDWNGLVIFCTLGTYNGKHGNFHNCIKHYTVIVNTCSWPSGRMEFHTIHNNTD